MGEATDRGVVIDGVSLEDAVERLMTWARIPSDRRGALAARLGWPDGQIRSLQEAGDMVGVTRERIRQIQVKFEERIRDAVRVPALERALALVRQLVPTTAERASQALIDAGLAKGPVHPRALVQIASTLGIDPSFEVGSLDVLGEVVMAPGASANPGELRALRAELKRRARPFGFIHVDLAAATTRELLGQDGDRPAGMGLITTGSGENLAELVLRAMGAITLGDGWYFVETDSREPAIGLIEDMLAVSEKGLTDEELRQGFERRLRWRGSAGHRNQEGWYPPGPAILGLCRSRPDRFRVEGNVVAPIAPLDWRERIPDAERIMLEILLESPGRVLHREDFERAAVERGVNPNTFNTYTSYTPFLRDLGAGLWAIRGVEPDPLEVEQLRRRRGPRQRQVEDWTWLPNGALRLSVRLRRITNTVVGVPAAVRSSLAGRTLEVVLPDGTRKGRVRVGENGTSWGYGPALGALGAQPGDLLLVDFHPATGTVHLSLDHA